MHPLHLGGRDVRSPAGRLRVLFSYETWFHVLGRVGLGAKIPMMVVPIATWWTIERSSIAKRLRKGFNPLAWLVAWSIWKERNCRVRECATLIAMALALDIIEEARLWIRAGPSGVS